MGIKQNNNEKKLINSIDQKFAQVWHETNNKSEAYRQTHDCSNWKQESIAVEACNYSKRPNVLLMFVELQEEAKERHEITVDSLIGDLERARMMAMEDPKGAGAAVSAVMGKAKICGFLTDKVNVSNSVKTNFPTVIRLVGKESI